MLYGSGDGKEPEFMRVMTQAFFETILKGRLQLKTMAWVAYATRETIMYDNSTFPGAEYGELTKAYQTARDSICRVLSSRLNIVVYPHLVDCLPDFFTAVVPILRQWHGQYRPAMQTYVNCKEAGIDPSEQVHEIKQRLGRFRVARANV